MSNVLIASKLLRSIKTRAMIPADQNTFTDEELLEIATEELNVFLVPYLLQSQEEYLVNFEDEVADSNRREFDIPYRAVGNKLRDLQLVNEYGEIVLELSRVSLEELADYKYTFGNSGFSDLFYIENNKIKLIQQFPGQNIRVRKYFYLRPNSLVQESNAGRILSIDRTSGVISMDKFPSSFNNTPLFDFVAVKSPNVILSYDVASTGINANARSVTVDPTNIPEDLAVGDYVCVAQESVVPQLPVELHPILAQRVAIYVLEALGDDQNKQSAERKLHAMEKSVDLLIDDRVEGAPQKIKQRYSPANEASSRYRIGRRGTYKL